MQKGLKLPRAPQGVEWGKGGHNQESRKTIRKVTRGRASDLKREKSYAFKIKQEMTKQENTNPHDLTAM